MEPERQAKILYVKHSKTVVWKQCTNASHRKPYSRSKIWYLFSILLVVTSTHQQTNDVQHYNGRHCPEHRSVPNDVEFLENRRKIDRVRWNE